MRAHPQVEQQLIMDHAHNPYSGTHKDIVSQQIRTEAESADVDTLVMVSAGNAARSLARVIHGSRLRLCAVLGPTVPDSVSQELEALGVAVQYQCLTPPLTSEQLCCIGRQTGGRKVWNVTEGFSYAYTRLLELLPSQPDHIVCPIGTGSLAIGLAEGIYRQGWHTRLTMVAVDSSAKKADKIITNFRENAHAIDHLQYMRGHRIIQLSAVAVEEAIAAVPTGVLAEPSAAVVFSPQVRYHCPGSTVLVNTGRGW